MTDQVAEPTEEMEQRLAEIDEARTQLDSDLTEARRIEEVKARLAEHDADRERIEAELADVRVAETELAEKRERLAAEYTEASAAFEAARNGTIAALSATADWIEQQLDAREKMLNAARIARKFDVPITTARPSPLHQIPAGNAAFQRVRAGMAAGL